MESLLTRLNSLNFTTQINEVNDLLDRAQPKITFFGGRVIEVKESSGSVYLDDIAKKLLNASEQHSDACNLTPQERIAGVEAVKKLKRFYEISDTQVQNSNFITRFFNFIREFTLLPYTTRFYFDHNADQNYRAFSKPLFIEQFGDTFDEWGEHPASDGSFGPPLRIAAREEQIRILLNSNNLV